MITCKMTHDDCGVVSLMLITGAIQRLECFAMEEVFSGQRELFFVINGEKAIVKVGWYESDQELKRAIELIHRVTKFRVEVIRAEGIAYGPEQDQAAMASAVRKIAAIAA